MTLAIKSNKKEIEAILGGKQKIVTREIRPQNARRFVTLNDELECTGIIEYDKLALETSEKIVTLAVEKIMLMEIEDENGELVHYEQKGVTYQMVDIDYHIGAVLSVEDNSQ